MKAKQRKPRRPLPLAWLVIRGAAKMTVTLPM